MHGALHHVAAPCGSSVMGTPVPPSYTALRPLWQRHDGDTRGDTTLRWALGRDLPKRNLGSYPLLVALMDVTL
eukprot:9758554-Karenia_brevis.AAC.1